MHIKLLNSFSSMKKQQYGVSLLELVVFIVIVGVAGTVFLKSYLYSAMHNADPIIQIRELEAAQSKLDEILALKYDEGTPTGDIPACNSINPVGAACDNTTDANMNDIDDFNGYSDSPYTGYTRSVTVTLSSANEKLITVTVTGPQSTTVSLAAYRANF